MGRVGNLDIIVFLFFSFKKDGNRYFLSWSSFGDKLWFYFVSNILLEIFAYATPSHRFSIGSYIKKKLKHISDFLLSAF